MNSDIDFWNNLRKEFALDERYVHLSNGMIVSHPRCVREAIELHRNSLNQNPVLYAKNREEFNQRVLNAGANYLNTSPDLIALTESTTMGLGIIYHGLKLTPDDEILYTFHEHFATQEALRYKSHVSGAKLKKIKLYSNSFEVKDDILVKNLIQHITDKTRVVALTWVHSCSGVKLPIAKIGKCIQSINTCRSLKEKILFCVDAVHALGIEDFEMDDLYCDFLIAGCHKSLFGPRGTGLVWGNKQAWQRIEPIIPSFDTAVFLPWLKNENPEDTAPSARLYSPGGFTAFEHRWALDEAFKFHLAIGKSRIADRIHALNDNYKQAMYKMPHIKLHTPLSKELSSGIICFEVLGKTSNEIVTELLKKNIIAGETPYSVSYARFMPGIYNTHEEIFTVLSALDALKL